MEVRAIRSDGAIRSDPSMLEDSDLTCSCGRLRSDGAIRSDPIKTSRGDPCCFTKRSPNRSSEVTTIRTTREQKVRPETVCLGEADPNRYQMDATNRTALMMGS